MLGAFQQRGRVPWRMVVFGLVLSGLLASAAELGSAQRLLDIFAASQETLVKSIAAEAISLHSQRTELVQNCECSRHGCTDAFEDALCTEERGALEICPSVGQLVLNTTLTRTPPGAKLNDLSPSLKESICVYKHIDKVGKVYRTDPGPVYVGTRDGHFTVYPGTPVDNRLQDGDQGCKAFDPRVRPWFIGASTGLKDIVLVVDTSESMNDLIGDGPKSKWNVAQQAVCDILETFTFADFVNVVTFSDTAHPLWTESGLVRGRAENLARLKSDLSEKYPRGRTNFTAAFNTAFGLLTDDCSVKPDSCSNCQKIILFLTDGLDTASGSAEGAKVSKITRTIDKLQRRLKAKTFQRAVVFTFSMSEQADDSVSRHIACSNSGAWSFIGPETNTLDALNSYFLYIAVGREKSSPIWIEPYEDAAGNGIVTTVAMPFFAGNTVSSSRIFLGVVGHDVKLAEFEALGVTPKQAMEHLIRRSSQCSTSVNPDCELQVFRNAHDARSICPDRFPGTTHDRTERRQRLEDRSSLECYQFNGGYYKRFYEKLSWEEAALQCQRNAGELVSIGYNDELAFVASLAAPDGTWIGARRRLPRKRFTWLDRSAPELKNNSDFWGGGQPIYEANEEQCVAIDSRGVIGNLATKRCRKRLPFICHYSDNSSCAAGTVGEPEGGFFEVPQLMQCLASKKAKEETSPVEEASSLKSDDVVCKIKSSNNSTYGSGRCCDVSQVAALPRLRLHSFFFIFAFMITFLVTFDMF